MDHAQLTADAIALFNERRFEQALARIAPLLQGDSASVDVLNIAAACARALGRPEQAEQYSRLALQRDPGHAPTWNNLGIVLQQLGRGAEAEAAYRQSLALQPDFADACYNLGLLYQQAGAHDAAAAGYRRALEIRPGYVDAHNNLGALHRMREQWPEALACFRQAVALQPDYAEAHNNLGLVLARLGRLPEAEASFRRALALRPDVGRANANLGMLLEQLGRFDEAQQQFGQAVAQDPADVESLHHRGDLLHKLGQWRDADACYRAALAHSPHSAELHNNLAVLQCKLGKPDAAEASYRQALALRPDYADALHNLALLYIEQRRHALAERALNDLLEMRPNDVEGFNSLGNLYQHMHSFDAAERAYRRALTLNPGSPKTLNNLAALLQQERHYEQAESAYRAAIERDPGYPEARWNLGFLLLAQGRLAEGWPWMEARYDAALARPIAVAPRLAFPQWQGEDLAGRSIVVWPEQGFGDQVQFVRYLPLLKATGARRVTLVCKDALVPLLRGAAGVDQVLAESEVAQLQKHDFWVFLLSLPMHFGTTLATIPAALPYLAADSARVQRWHSKIDAPGKRVGLVWRGFGGHVNDANRSLPGLDCLAPLWTVPGVSFVSLQRGMEGPAGVSAAPGQPILDLGPGIGDFADTAAIVSLLDLVICVDTAVAHVAGALGKECWVVLPAVHPDWRWMEGRADSPWYPGVLRLYRQTRPGDWSAVADTLAADLASWIKKVNA